MVFKEYSKSTIKLRVFKSNIKLMTIKYLLYFEGTLISLIQWLLNAIKITEYKLMLNKIWRWKINGL